MDIGQIGLYACLFLGLYFEVFLLISFLEKQPGSRTGASPARYPSVSILVPSYNEEKTIGGTIESLLALRYPSEKLEIVVINDGSKDGTEAIARQYAHRDPRVRVLTKENGGKYTALNLGIAQSSGELVGCLDADSFVDKDALIEVVKRFEEDPKMMALTPAMMVHRPRKMLELMQSVEYTFGIFYKKMFDNLSAINVLPGPFSIYRREVFEKIGVFRHAHNTEDMEIAFRMHANGLPIGNAHTALVYTTVPSTVRGLIKQRTRWSQGYLQNSRDYAYMYFNPRFGNFGMLVLPFGLAAFLAGLYTAGYALWRLSSYIVGRIGDTVATHIPPHLPSAAHLEWFYISTNMLTLVIVAILFSTLAAIVIGQRISQTRLPLASFISYFALFSFIAPVWLARAAWGALRAQESVWR